MVRQHESTYESQSIYKHLSACCEENAKAALDSSSLLACITAARIDEWKGSSESFILNWQEKVRQYELLVKSEENFSDAIKLTMLQNAVSHVEHLKQVKGTANQLKVSLRQDLLYDGCEKILKETVITHDSKLRVQPSRAVRKVHEHEVEYYDEPPDPGEELDIDSSIETVLANKSIAKFKPTNPLSLMPKEAHLKLPPAARSTWNKLDSDSKALILLAHKQKADALPPKPPYKDNKSPSRFALAELHQLLESQYESTEIESTPEDTDDDATRLVNFSQAKEATPGDIRKLLSVPNKKGHDNVKGKAQVNASKVDKPEVVIDGATYRAANVHITYSLSSSNRIHKQSLVD